MPAPGPPPQLIEDREASFVVALLVLEQFGEQDLSPIADTAMRYLFFLQESNEVQARDIEQIGSLLRGQLGLSWRYGHGVSCRQLSQDKPGALSSAVPIQPTRHLA